MATRKSINITENYGAPHKLYAFFIHIYNMYFVF